MRYTYRLYRMFPAEHNIFYVDHALTKNTNVDLSYERIEIDKSSSEIYNDTFDKLPSSGNHHMNGK